MRVILATTVPDALRRAAYILDHDGWIQGNYKDQCGVCAMGALRIACWGSIQFSESEGWTVERNTTYGHALTWLGTADGLYGTSECNDVAAWNDRDGQTVENVTAVMRQAAADYEKAHPTP